MGMERHETTLVRPQVSVQTRSALNNHNKGDPDADYEMRLP